MSADYAIDAKFVKKLRETTPIKLTCGNLMHESYGHNVSSALEQQLAYLAMCLKAVSPRTILEVGTNEGLFCYFAKLVLPNVRIVTFDNNESCNSAEAVALLHQYFGSPYIKFIEGDSKETLTSFAESRAKTLEAPAIEFAWIDGSHATVDVLSDLRNCAKIQISNLFLDDFKLLIGSDLTKLHFTVSVAIKQFLQENNDYIFISVSDDSRGIAHIRRKESSDE